MAKFVSLDEAVALIPDGASIMVGGFMGCGNPHKIIDALSKSGKGNFTLICNDGSMPGGPLGEDYYGVAKLIHNGQVTHLIATHVGLNPEVAARMNDGSMKVDLIPQGSLAEMIRADGAGLGGVGEHAHGMNGGGHQLFRPLNAVEVMAYAPEGVGNRLTVALEELRLLEYRVRLAAGKGIAGQHQQRDTVGRGAARGGDHVHGAGTNGADAGNDLPAVFLLGKGCGSQGHVLLILALEEADAVPALGQGLAYAHHATVAKHTEDIVDKFIGNAIHFHILPV